MDEEDAAPRAGLLRRAVRHWVRPLLDRAARAYVAGPAREDALRVIAALERCGFASSLGFWDGPGDRPAAVAREYLAGLEEIAAGSRNSYLSIKLSALGGSSLRLTALLARARRSGVRIHFDSLGPDTADANWAAAERAARAGGIVGVSVPGRWRRSLIDVEAAIAAGIVPRVVKGQWADPSHPGVDPRRGFLAVVDRLAGRIPVVAVATHDGPLAREAITRLRTAGTNVELEVLYGMPQRAVLIVAADLGVPVRMYVPYGCAYLPYCRSRIRRNPRLLFAVLRDAVTAAPQSRYPSAGEILSLPRAIQASPRE